jgi:hypothetical protein
VKSITTLVDNIAIKERKTTKYIEKSPFFIVNLFRYPVVPDDDIGKWIHKALLEFVKDSSKLEYDFSPKLENTERRRYQPEDIFQNFTLQGPRHCRGI